MTIDRPGIYTIPAAQYHADPCPEPSLSCSLAKILCFSSALHAHHAHPRLNPSAEPEHGDHFDLGTAAHALLLEGRDSMAVIDAPDWRTKAAKDQRDAARDAGLTLLLAHVAQDVVAMVGALRDHLHLHTDGGALMFTDGQPEQTLIWCEDDVWCRARLDWLRSDFAAIDDYKTTSASANPEAWARTMFAAGHDLQAAWYLRGLRAVTGARLDDLSAFRFAVQETSAPYAVSVIALNHDAMFLAEKKCEYALEQFREALASGDWRGYPRRTAYATLPAWEEARWLEKELR